MGVLEESQVSENVTPEERFYAFLSEKAPRTQRQYTVYLNELAEFLEKDINQLVAFHKEDCLLRDGGALRRAFLKYVTYATTERERPLSRATAEYRLKPLNITLGLCNLPKIKIDHSTAHPKAKVLIKSEHIKELIQYCGKSKRNKAMIYTLKDTGLRVGDVAGLLVEDYIGASRHYDEQGREYRVWKNPIITNKIKNVIAKVHMGFEAIESLTDYIGDRTTGAIFLQTQHNTGAPVKSGTITRIFNDLTASLKERGYDVSAHSFRKSFLTNTMSRGLLEPMAKMICGKHVPRTDSTYYQWEAELTEAYIRVYSEALALDTVKVDHEETVKLRAKVAAIERMLADMKSLPRIPADQQKRIGEDDYEATDEELEAIRLKYPIYSEDLPE